MICFFVPGDPVTQGSSKAFAFKRPNGSIGARVVTKAGTEGNPLGNWRARIAQFAQEAMGSAAPTDKWLTVNLSFYFKRPKSIRDHNARPTSRRCGDLDKLTRAVYDGLTGVVFTDDSLVCSGYAAKHYTGDPSAPRFQSGVLIEIYLSEDLTT